MLTRRELLSRSGLGLGSLALAGLFADDAQAAPSGRGAERINPMTPRPSHFPARAKHVIHVFLNGGCSQVDTFDPKPALEKYAGKSLPMENLRTERKTGAAFPSPYKFAKYGESGIEVSEIFPHLAQHVDRMCFIRSMHAEVPNHEPSLLLMNCGEQRLVRPCVGSWLTYGLGTENQNLPGFVVMCPGGYPIAESANWRSAFLPGVFQGAHVDPNKTKIDEIIEHVRNDRMTLDEQRGELDLLRTLNTAHRESRPGDPRLEARIQSFELAYRMQTEAAEAFDVTREPKSVQDLYGPGVHARQCLIARRLVERGVRMVQLWHGNGQPWDNHDDLEQNHRRLAGQCDQGLAALLSDLDQRGLLDETIVMCSGEFGRTPVVELPQPGANSGKINGRDHNHYGFTCWLAGGGFKGGHVHGATDEFGFKAVESPVHVHDLHATLLHQLGLDHERLTYRHAGRDFRLTDVHGQVVHEVLA
jgi:hypothetical protein